MKIVEQPDIFLREPTSEVKFPLSSEDQVIIDQMIDMPLPLYSKKKYEPSRTFWSGSNLPYR